MQGTNIASVVKAYQAMFDSIPTEDDYKMFDYDSTERYTKVLYDTFSNMGKLLVEILFTEMFVYLRLKNGEWQIGIFDTLEDCEYFINAVEDQPETAEVKIIEFNEFTEFAKEQTGNLYRYLVISDTGIVTFDPCGINARHKD